MSVNLMNLIYLIPLRFLVNNFLEYTYKYKYNAVTRLCFLNGLIYCF